jgi:signal transduction histidine kinase
MRRLLHQLPLRWKLALLISATTTIVMLLSAVALYHYEASTLRDVLARDLSATARMTALSSAGPLAFNDNKDAEELLHGLRGHGNIIRAAILDRNRNVFAEYHRSDVAICPLSVPDSAGCRFEADSVHLLQPVVQAGDELGNLYIVSDLQRVSERLDRYVNVMAMMIVLSIIVSFLLASVLQRAVSGPILQLSKTAQEIGKSKDFARRAPAHGSDEIGQLINQFNLMLEQIQMRDDQVQAAHMELERKVDERTKELQHANEELDSFASSVSHDLRAPLRQIGGFVDLLDSGLTGKLGPSEKDHIEEIKHSVQDASRLIDDLLSFSRMSRSEMQMLTFDMSELVQEVVADSRRQIVDREIEWVVQPMTDVMGDLALLRQVWRNLIANAVKYSRTRKNSRIEIGAKLNGHEKVFFVRDNGVGFDMQYARRLFGVFHRLHGAEFEGTGIGLANVRRIIERHGGRTWAEGKVNDGAIFYFSLPNHTI